MPKQLLRLTEDRTDAYHQDDIRTGDGGGPVSAENGNPGNFTRRRLLPIVAATLRVLKPYDPNDRDDSTDNGVKLGRPGSIEARRRRLARRRSSR